MHFTAPSVLIALAVAPFASGLGINCRGSSLCSSYGNGVTTVIQSRMATSFFPAGKTFSNGEHIACNGNICAFLQNTSGPKGIPDLQRYIQDLINHNCQVCGSDPTEPGNDVARGQFTVNYVTNPRPFVNF